ncbi:SPOR domain-containing protein [Thalassomonas sp. M1454]|uniref:SPOR domain-containing protein n=1 Tax=Thalassomonas sp. M1454 TaxID=2594477 RepID=UPI00117D66F8|nr:SPOR domain-containing protein [Thalassomonas sp. M1454]TRX53416.1 cell division protein FtsN [Thalassomonas sp. M1454]
MAHQDYVARPRATKKKKNPYKPKGKKAVANNSGFKPVFIGLIIVAIISTFAYFLFSLKNNASDVEGLEIKLSEPANSTEYVEEDPLPEPPTEDWSYFKNLPEKDVAVGDYDVKESGPYQMQCASFRNQNDAEKLKAKIAFTGLSSTVRKSVGSNGTWYKVVLGPFERKRQAESAKHKLKRNKINGCQIWLWT